jgi:hypothetical protein
MTRLERRCRWLLLAYPDWYRRERVELSPPSARLLPAACALDARSRLVFDGMF